jgi:hypothetical protein
MHLEKFMAAQTLTSTTNTLIETYGNTAKNVVHAYRVGNARAARFVDQSWASAVAKTSGRLSDDLRQRAVDAQRKLSVNYVHAVALSADGAEIAINKALDVSGKTISQWAANADRLEQAAGVAPLQALAKVALPAAQVVQKIATSLEVQSARLLNTVEGEKAAVRSASVKRKSAVKATAKAAPKAVKVTAKVTANVTAKAAAKVSTRKVAAKPAAKTARRRTTA